MIRVLVPLAVIVFLAALVICAREESAVFQICIQDQQHGYSAEQQIESSAIVPLPILDSRVIAWRCTGAFLDANEPAITAFATIVIAIFTVILAAVTGRQATLTKESLIADKRAFVHCNGIAQYFIPIKESALHEWRFRPQWQNSGDTPTKNMTMFVECEVRTSPLPPGFDFDQVTVPPGSAFIAPRSGIGGGLAPTPGRAAVSPQDIADSQANRKFIYVWGWAKYNDVFPRTPQHVTRFCFLLTPIGDPMRFDPKAKTPDLGTLTFPYVYNTEGNCADDECG